jgi:hypothetical protein
MNFLPLLRDAPVAEPTAGRVLGGLNRTKQVLDIDTSESHDSGITKGVADRRALFSFSMHS